MKKIIITESQLKKITESLINEQSSAVILGGLKTFLNVSNPNDENNFGTLTMVNNKNKPIKIRFIVKVPIMGNNMVNIVKLNPQSDGSAFIETKKGFKKTLSKDVVDRLIIFVNNDAEKTLKDLVPGESGTLNVMKLN